jgi:hypothetical protein
MGTLVGICVACAAYLGWESDPFWVVPVMAGLSFPAARPSAGFPWTLGNVVRAYAVAFVSLAGVYGIGWGLSRLL